MLHDLNIGILRKEKEERITSIAIRQATSLAHLNNKLGSGGARYQGVRHGERDKRLEQRPEPLWWPG
jgi:hypothetical protein